MIHVNRGTTSLGVFSEQEIREGLSAGRFAPTDIGWREGMATWQPLSQFPEFGGVAAPAVPPVQPGAVPMSSAAKTEPLAIWSLVLSLVGLFCCGFVVGIGGVVCGHLALKLARTATARQGLGDSWTDNRLCGDCILADLRRLLWWAFVFAGIKSPLNHHLHYTCTRRRCSLERPDRGNGSCQPRRDKFRRIFRGTSSRRIGHRPLCGNRYWLARRHGDGNRSRSSQSSQGLLRLLCQLCRLAGLLHQHLRRHGLDCLGSGVTKSVSLPRSWKPWGSC